MLLFSLVHCITLPSCSVEFQGLFQSVSGQFGFLSYELEEGKKLFFHMSEVKDGANLQAGDSVEFVVVTNQRNGKSFACNVSKLP